MSAMFFAAIFSALFSMHPFYLLTHFSVDFLFRWLHLVCIVINKFTGVSSLLQAHHGTI
jgi:hypothetical protein